MRSLAAFVIGALALAGAGGGSEATGREAGRGQAIVGRLARSVAGPGGTAVRGFRATYRAVVSVGGDELPSERTVSFELPDRIRFDLGGDESLVFSGSTGHLSAGTRALPLSERRVEAARLEMGRDPLVLVLGASTSGLQASAEGRGTVDGTPCDLVAVRWLGAESQLCIDEAGHLLRLRYAVQDPQASARATFEVRFEDQRAVPPWNELPHRRVLERDGLRIATITLVALELDPAFPAGHFGPPSDSR